MTNRKKKIYGDQSIGHDYVRSILRYEPDTGKLYWADGISRKRSKDRRAGFKNPRSNYRQVQVDEFVYYEHVLVWFWVNGSWPPEGYEIDHIDRDRANNKIANLRLATKTQNAQNQSGRRAASGFKGVYLVKGKWLAAIRVNGKLFRLGRFESRENAAAAYDAAAIKYFGGFAAPNFRITGSSSDNNGV